MHSNHCKNCEHLLSETHHFCPNCGQTAHIHKISLRYLLHEFFHAFTHADKGILLLLKNLATKPGQVLREYIIEGKRKKYFNPFTFLLLVLAFSVLMNKLVHPFETEAKPDPVMLAKFSTPKARTIYLHMLNKQVKMNNFFEQKSNWVTLMSAPIFTLLFWLIFKRRKLNYAEHFVAYAYMIGFAILATSIILVPLMSIAKGTKYYFYLVAINLLFQIFYFTWSYKDFLDLHGTKSVIRITLSSLLAVVLWMIICSVGITMYFMFF